MSARPRPSASERAAVVLVALCFVAVIGIVLASYVAVCNRAMNLSNRAFQTSLSKQLAEAGIDEAMRAFNKQNWTDWTSGSLSVDWDISTYSASKRAVATMTFPTTSLGQGSSATVKLRVDNYDAQVLGATWSSSVTYQLNDVVAYSGMWYRCMQTTTGNTPPDLRYWAPAPIPWKWSDDITYAQYDAVNHGGVWYRYFNAASSAGNAVTDTTRWNTIPTRSTWAASTPYAVYDVITHNGTEYYCSTPHTSGVTFDTSNWTAGQLTPISLSWSSGVIFPRGALAFHNGAWYYCITGHLAATNPSTDTTNWAPLVTNPTASTWSATKYYFPGDYVYNSGWFRCILAHSNQSTANGTYWSNVSSSPYFSWAYRSIGYEFNDVVFYSSSGAGTWYRRDTNATGTIATPTNTSSWENALADSWDWDSADSYNIGDVVYLSSTSSFYRCIRAHSNATPPNSTYWSAEAPYSTYWDSGRNYETHDLTRYRGLWYKSLRDDNSGNIPGADATYWAVAPRTVSAWSSTTLYHIDDIVSSSGVWYRCIQDNTNQSVGTNTYWKEVAGASYAWTSTTAAASGAYYSYGGVWYKCTAGNTGQSPNNTNYWTPTWADSWGVTTGAPVVYVEATVTLGDRTTSKTQLRATLEPQPLFPNAVGASTTITVTSGTGTIDSYDSQLASWTNTDALKRYSAIVATGTESTSGTSTLLSIGGTTAVKGLVATLPSTTSPYAPRASYGSGTTVQGATSAVSPNVDTSQVSRSPYVPTPDLQTMIQQTSIPTTLPSTTLNLNLGTPGAPTPSVYYYSTNLSVDNTTEVVNINGPVILRVNGYIRCSTGTFKVTDHGSVVASLTNYFRNYASSPGFQNLTLDPKKMLFLSSAPTTTTTANYLIASTTDANFYGAIYMPNTGATLGMDVRTGTVIHGAINAREVTFSTEATLHYDTSLRYATFSGVDQPYLVSDWRELETANWATLP